MKAKDWSTWILIVGLLLLVIGFVGYALPRETPENPERVFYETAGGPVLFPHSHHCEELGMDCADCHHEIASDDQFVACRTCHTTGEGESPTCDSCHGDAGYTADMLDHEDLVSIEGHTCDGCHIARRAADALHGSCNMCHEGVEEGTFLTVTEENGKSTCDICHMKQ